MSLFNGRKKEMKRATSQPAVTSNPFEEEEKKADNGPKQSKTQALASNAKAIAKDLVPEGSTATSRRAAARRRRSAPANGRRNMRQSC